MELTRLCWSRLIGLCVFLIHYSSQQLSEEEQQTPESYRVVRFAPHTEEQLSWLKQLAAHDEDFGLDFWVLPTGIHGQVDVMAPPDLPFEDWLEQRDFQYNITIPDVQKFLEKKKTKSKVRKQLMAGFGRRMHDSVGGAPRYELNEYNGYNQMRRYMAEVVRKYPNLAQDMTIGWTHERRPIVTMKLGSPIRDERKPVIWIDGGIHAREWAAPHTAIYFIDRLVKGYGSDPDITAMLNAVTFYITPVVNPDGYEYTRSSLQPSIRLWRKNRSPSECRVDNWGRRRCCQGVDLNRNFQFFWGQTGSSDNPCSEIYAGQKPFSEPESKAVRDTLMSERLRGKVAAFITMHTYSQIWIHPYGHKVRDYPSDKNDLKRLGDKAATELKKLYGTQYVVGSGADTLYPAAGGSDDWAKAVVGVKYVYLLELRPDDRQWDGFILDESELIPTGRETWAGISVVVEQVMHDHGVSLREEANRSSSSNNRSSTSTSNSSSKSSRSSASFTTADGQCSDRRYACRRWHENTPGICRQLKFFMRQECARTCKFC